MPRAGVQGGAPTPLPSANQEEVADSETVLLTQGEIPQGHNDVMCFVITVSCRDHRCDAHAVQPLRRLLEARREVDKVVVIGVARLPVDAIQQLSHLLETPELRERLNEVLGLAVLQQAFADEVGATVA